MFTLVSNFVDFLYYASWNFVFLDWQIQYFVSLVAEYGELLHETILLSEHRISRSNCKLY